MRKPLSLAAVLLATTVILTSCGGDDPPVAAPTPTPTPTTASYEVLPCVAQQVTPTRNVASLILPDVLTIDLSQPAGFPNGRQPDDPVIDRTLAMIFLDLQRHSIDTFANIPVNPRGDSTARTSFPWLQVAFGGQRPSQGGTNFNFRTDSESAYTRVDRMGMPAIATALVGSATKNTYNDDNPAGDLQTAPGTSFYRYAPEFVTQLTTLTNALADDFQALNLSLCARRL